MKKFLTAFLFVCACAFTAAAVGCGDNKPGNSAGLGEDRKVTFEEGEGFTIQSNLSDEGVIPEGSQLMFEVELGGFYAGTPIAYVNDKPYAADEEGIFSIPVGDKDMVIRIDGVRKDVSNMQGSGAFDDAFVVSRPIDLVYIAEQVNLGVQRYVTGAYVLANDIDCKGEELKVIGDRKQESAVFCGSFSSVADENTGLVADYTISNFTINSEDSNYVGLFGAVFKDMTVQGSGLFYNVNIDNFTINAGVSELAAGNKTLSCGGLIGYGVGTTLFLCDATNGEVNVTSDQNYFSFVGGLIGYQQGFYDNNYNQFFPAETTYSVVDTDVNILGGVSLYAGGVAGYIATNYPYAATASVHNSYSLGNVNGALRSGGVVGGMGQYTVVSNCYATGEVTARSSQPYNSPIAPSEEYSHAYAGGIVGYGENDTVAHDSFFTGILSATAVSGAKYEHSSHAVGGGDEAGFVSVRSEKTLAINCLDEVNLDDDKAIAKALGWQNYDWIFTAGELPVINYDAPTAKVTLMMTLKYVAPKSESTKILIDGEQSTELQFFNTQSGNTYSPIGSFMASGSLPEYYTAENGYLSYGYFFDKECTQKVPYSYMPGKNITLYVGFADPTPVVGEYYLMTENSTAPYTINLYAQGIAVYSDGNTMSSTNYIYDGETLILEAARLARYYQGEVVQEDEDTPFLGNIVFDPNRYSHYSFEGKLVNGSLVLYDGVYFTKDAPLHAQKNAIRGEYYSKDAQSTTYYTFYGNSALVEKVLTSGKTTTAEYDTVLVNGNTVRLSHSEGNQEVITLNKINLTQVDNFKGVWTKSATVDKVFTFDGAGNFTYTHTVYERNSDGYTYTCDPKVLSRAQGNYTVNGETMTFTMDGVTYTATIVDEALEISGKGTPQRFYAEHSHKGTWRGSNYELILEGINSDGYGYATLVDNMGFETALIYEISQTENVIAFYYVNGNSKDTLYGYATYDLRSNVFSFVLSDANAETGYSEDILYLYDDYYGEWVTDLPQLENVEFLFNGLGLYSYLGTNMQGSLTLVEDGKRTTVKYEIASDLSGSFAYEGVKYEMYYDEDLDCVVITLGVETDLLRKDELANVPFVDMNGNRYVFDGRSALTSGGTLTVGEKNYAYFPATDGYTLLDGNATVGSLVEGSNHFLLTLNGVTTELYLANDFMGDWAINQQYALFHIGPTDTNGIIKATYKGSPVELTYIDPTTLTFRYREDKMPITYYVFIMEDDIKGQDILLLSEFTNPLMGEYIVCSKASELFGTWVWNRDGGKTTFAFDGVNSGYANGYAVRTLQLNNIVVTTDYYFSIREDGILVWTRDLMAGRTWYYSLEMATGDLDEAAKNKEAFVLRDADGNVKGVFLLTEVDGLYLVEAKDKDGAKYFFDGMGNLLVNGVKKYTYVIKSYNANDTATLEVTDIATGITYTATLDYSTSPDYLFTLGEKVVTETAD